MSQDPTQPLYRRKRVDDLCNQFETKLAAGEAPRIEDFLTQVEAAQREELFYELLAIEIWHRRAAGQQPVLKITCTRSLPTTWGKLFAAPDPPAALCRSRTLPAQRSVTSATMNCWRSWDGRHGRGLQGAQVA